MGVMGTEEGAVNAGNDYQVMIAVGYRMRERRNVVASFDRSVFVGWHGLTNRVRRNVAELDEPRPSLFSQRIRGSLQATKTM
jgi:hypothetical protein